MSSRSFEFTILCSLDCIVIISSSLEEVVGSLARSFVSYVVEHMAETLDGFQRKLFKM